jgi:hypothetical protein
MFDGFFPLASIYRSIFIANVSGVPVEPSAPPTYRLIGPAGLVEGHIDQNLSEIDLVDGVHSWTPDITLDGVHFTRGATYHIVVRYVVADDTLVDVRSFTVT